MESSQQQAEPGLFSTVDFRAFLSTLRVRWWLIPLVLAITNGFLIAQQSRLKTEPQAYRVSRTYEVPNPLQFLAPLGINPALVTETPDAGNQLRQLRSSEISRQVSQELGVVVPVEVPLSYDEPFTLSCESDEQVSCERTLDVYEVKASEIRRFAVTSTLSTLRAVFIGAYEATDDPIAKSKVAGIDGLLKGLDVNLIRTDSYVQPIGSTVGDAGDVDFRFGIISGLIISLLVLLQLTYSDSRVRSSRQLVRLVSEHSFLGALSRTENPVSDRRIALALFQDLNKEATRQIAFVPLRRPVIEVARLQTVANMAEGSHIFLKPLAQMSVAEIASSGENGVSVVVVRRNQDLRADVVDAMLALRRSGRRFAGFLLLD